MRSPPWLLMLYQLPARPSTLRVTTWRRLKATGALYLQNAVCLLPKAPETEEVLSGIARDIAAANGEARVYAVRMSNARDNSGIIAAFRAQSDDEYREFLGKCRDFHTELQAERRKRHFTFAELDENEAEVEKLRSWLAKIRTRDFFGGKLVEAARRELLDCERDFARFGREVEAESGAEGPRRPGRRRARSRS